VKCQFIDAKAGKVVENEDQVKGYDISRGQYVTVEDDELSAIALEGTHTIDIESFAPRTSIDERYLDTPYYIAPDDRVAQEAFAVIRETGGSGPPVQMGRSNCPFRKDLAGLGTNDVKIPIQTGEDRCDTTTAGSPQRSPELNKPSSDVPIALCSRDSVPESETASILLGPHQRLMQHES
jgi:hypothetical protein